MSKAVQSKTRTHIEKNGDVLYSHEETNVFKLATEDDYVKVYVKDISYLVGLQGNQWEILNEILKNMNYGNLIILNSFIKEKICETLGVKQNTINKALTLYKQTGVLIHEGRATYRANPCLFGKGKWEDIQKLRAEIVWSPQGKTIKAIVDTNSSNEVMVVGKPKRETHLKPVEAIENEEE